MKDGKKLYLIILGVFIILVLAFVIIFNGTPSKNNVKKGNNQSKEMSDVKLSKVKDYDLFFNYQAEINEYLKAMAKGSKNDVTKLLSSRYINSHDNFLNEDTYDQIVYMALEMYSCIKNNYQYVFTKGYERYYSILDELLDLETTKYYLIIIDIKNGTYSITPLENINNLYQYAVEYTYTETKIEENSLNSIIYERYDDFYIINAYSSYFKHLLSIDYKKAYSMLSDSLKAEMTINEFYQNVPEYYLAFAGTIKGYSTKVEDGHNIYTFITGNDYWLQFTENGLMDFEVLFR